MPDVERLQQLRRRQAGSALREALAAPKLCTAEHIVPAAVSSQNRDPHDPPH
jgi:hypothetical protein